MEQITKNLKNLRTGNGWTQAETAASIGINLKRYSKWETGKALPRITFLPLIARLFEVTLEDLLENELTVRPPEGLATVEKGATNDTGKIAATAEDVLN